MKKYILLFLILTSVSSAQFPMLAAWNSSSFDPFTIDSLRFWLVASDVADSLGKSSGDTTFVWPNRVSPSIRPIQTVDARKPIYQDSSGTKLLRFDGADDRLQAPADFIVSSQPNTIFIVAKMYATNGFRMYYDGSGTSAERNQLYLNDGTPQNALYLFSGSAVSAGVNISIDTLYTLTAVFNGARSLVRVNGLQYPDANAGTQVMDGLTIGSVFAASAGFANMSVTEMLVYDGLLTASEISQVESYLLAKYKRVIP